MAEDLLLDPVPRDAALDLPVTCALEAGVLLRGVEGSTAAAACSRMKGTTCFNSWRRCSAEDVRAVGSWAHHRPNAAASSGWNSDTSGLRPLNMARGEDAQTCPGSATLISRPASIDFMSSQAMIAKAYKSQTM